MPVLLSEGCIQWKTNEVPDYRGGVLGAGHYTAAGQVRRSGTDVYFLQNSRQADQDYGLLQDKTYVTWFPDPTDSAKLVPVLTQRTSMRARGYFNYVQEVCNDYQITDLLQHSYVLTPKELRSWPLLMDVLEEDNLIVATGSSGVHLVQNFTDQANFMVGLQTGTAYHARKQATSQFNSHYWEQRTSLIKYWMRAW